jgi:hypothetical protein
MGRVFVVIGGLALGGCVTAEQQADRMDYAQRLCDSYSRRVPNPVPFDKCIAAARHYYDRQDQQDARQTATALAIIAAAGLANALQAYQPMVTAPAPRTCTGLSTGGVTTMHCF